MVFLRLAACILSLASVGFSQQTDSPLAGKIVHLYNPFAPDTAIIDLSGKGYAMTPEVDNWVKFDFATVPGGVPVWLNDFNLRTSNYSQRLGKDGYGKNGNYSATDFGTANEIWIMVDPHGPFDAIPSILMNLPRKVNVLNPWPINGPVIYVNGVKKSMLVTEGHCGWYTEYLMDVTNTKVYFASVADGQTWGAKGFDDLTPFDLTAAFATQTEAWISDSRIVSSTYPGKEGTCSYRMAAIVHDMAQAHPDNGKAGPGGGGSKATLGMVETTLGADHKPVFVDKARATLNTWFNSDPTKAMPLKGAEYCVDLDMGKSQDGLWEYDSYRNANHSFFPIDSTNSLDANQTGACYHDRKTGQYNPADTKPHNFGFCMESHATFKYAKGQVFDFLGDDDVWVYINGKLALDLGGRHEDLAGSIELDKQGLVEGNQYNWDFFYCEREPCGSSLRIKTTIYFKQQRALDHAEEKLPDGTTRYRIIKRVGGTGACGSSTDSLKEVDPTELTYILYNGAGVKIQDLAEGLSLGGINILTPRISVDTSKMVSLPPGPYRIVYFEPSNAKLQDEVLFTISARNRVELDPPYTIVNTVGTLVSVVAANRFKETLMAEVGVYSLSIPLGLEVYEDKAKTKKVTTGMALTTMSDGLDTLWVTGDSAALEDKTYLLAIPLSPKSVNLKFTLAPLDLPKATHVSVFDDDADGIGDRLVAVYDRDITATLPKQIGYAWPSSSSLVKVNPPDIAHLVSAAHLVSGTTLTVTGKHLSTSVVTVGNGQFTSTYQARAKDSIQSLPIQDRIAPVLLKAEMFSGMITDTLRLTFSEPVDTGAIAVSPKNLFAYRISQASPNLEYESSTAMWNAARNTLDLTFPAGFGAAPRSGNLVRIMEGLGRITDDGGYGVGSNSRFRLITGVARSEIKTVTFKKFESTMPPSNGQTIISSLEPSNTKVEEVVMRTGLLGHLIKMDLGDYAQTDDFNNVDPAQVYLEYHVSYFTNHGLPVTMEKKKVSCLDTLFQGDCRQHRGFLFLGWNFTNTANQWVATGAYIARLRYKVIVAGVAQESGGLDQVWGVLRSR